MKIFGVSDKGLVRQENQDSFRISQSEDGRTAVLVLCDGMGGENNGSMASSLAADAFMTHAAECLAEEPALDIAAAARESAAYANIRVFDRASTDDACMGMGTTLVAAVIRGDEAAVANIGDSRCYWLAENQLRQVTRDHSLVQDLVERGVLSPADARTHPQRNIITRAVGLEHRARCDIFLPALQEGDTLLLCSDGLSNLMAEEELAEVLRTRPEPEAAAASLLHTALLRGAPDNVTILILRR